MYFGDVVGRLRFGAGRVEMEDRGGRSGENLENSWPNAILPITGDEKLLIVERRTK